LELIQSWTRDGREKRLFFAQIEASLVFSSQGWHSAEEIGRFAFMLFTANGHESGPLFGSLPTSIAHEGNWRGGGMAPEALQRIRGRERRLNSMKVSCPY